jgi:hypothetical protein
MVDEERLARSISRAIADELEKQETESGPASGTGDELTPQVRSSLLDGIGPEDLELTADTFNPSSLFNDKTQAEWFGNIVANASKDAFKGIISQATKLPRWVWVLVLVAGIMIGFVAYPTLAGSLGGHAASTGASTGTGSSLPLPPPPSFTTTSTTVAGGG